MRKDSSNRVLIISTYPPGYGGISIHTKDLIELLEQNGRKVELLRLNQSSRKLIGQLLRLIFFKINRISTLHFHTSLFSFYMIVLILLMKVRCYNTNKKFVLTIHEGDIWNRMKEYSRLKFWLINNVLCVTDVCVFVSDQQLRHFNEIFIHDVHKVVISPLIQNNKTLFRNRYDMNACFRFVTVGQYQELYGITEVLDAVEQIAIREYNCSLIIIVGSDNVEKNYRKKVISRVSELNKKGVKVDVFENIPRDMVFEKYDESDIFIRNTRADSFGLSISEAIAHGLICFASNVCERPEGVFKYEPSTLTEVLVEYIGDLDQGIVFNYSTPKLITSSYVDYNRVYSQIE